MNLIELTKTIGEAFEEHYQLLEQLGAWPETDEPSPAPEPDRPDDQFVWSEKETVCFTLSLAEKHLEGIADDLSRLCLSGLEEIVAKIDRATIGIRNLLSARYDDCEC